MKLFYSPGACSLGVHVALEEIGAPFTTQRISTRDGSNLKPEYLAVNPKGKVPALALDDGTVITEYPAIAMYLARANPGAALLPEGLRGEIDCLSVLDYIAGTVHPMGFTRQFRAARFASDAADEPRVIADGKAAAESHLDVLAASLRGPWYFGAQYTLADSALFFIEQWCGRAQITPPPAISDHHQRMLARPAVQRALATESTVP